MFHACERLAAAVRPARRAAGAVRPALRRGRSDKPERVPLRAVPGRSGRAASPCCGTFTPLPHGRPVRLACGRSSARPPRARARTSCSRWCRAAKARPRSSSPGCADANEGSGPAGPGGGTMSAADRAATSCASSCDRSPTPCRSASWPWRRRRSWSAASSSTGSSPGRESTTSPRCWTAFVVPLQLLTSVLGFLADMRRRHRHGRSGRHLAVGVARSCSTPRRARRADALGLLLLGGVGRHADSGAHRRR